MSIWCVHNYPEAFRWHDPSHLTYFHHHMLQSAHTVYVGSVTHHPPAYKNVRKNITCWLSHCNTVTPSEPSFVISYLLLYIPRKYWLLCCQIIYPFIPVSATNKCDKSHYVGTHNKNHGNVQICCYNNLHALLVSQFMKYSFKIPHLLSG